MVKQIVVSEICQGKEPVTDKLLLVDAEICFDSKRQIGCPICSQYDCTERDL